MSTVHESLAFCLCVFWKHRSSPSCVLGWKGQQDWLLGADLPVVAVRDGPDHSLTPATSLASQP